MFVIFVQINLHNITTLFLEHTNPAFHRQYYETSIDTGFMFIIIYQMVPDFSATL